MKRCRVGEVLLAEGLKWRQEETWFEIEEAARRATAPVPNITTT